MGEENKKALEQQLWNIANELRGKMDADEFRDYILGFIFYKYLSEKIENFTNELLKEDGITFTSLDSNNSEHEEILNSLKDDCVQQLGYFLKPNELFSAMAKKDLRSSPSTLAIKIYFPLNFMAPALNAALMPKRSIKYGFVAGLRS